MLRAVAIAVALLGVSPEVARGADSWRWPVRGEVVERYSFDPATPFRAGQRRGISIAAPPGAPVRAVCAGRVVFAGNVGRAGPTLSVQCGPLRSTYQGLSELFATAGESVSAGEPVATAGAGPLRLGARRGRTYVDPQSLLPTGPPLGPSPARRIRRPPPPPRTPTPPVTPPRALPRAAPAREGPMTPVPAPLLAWVGAGLLALAVPAGTLTRRHRRRRARAAAIAVSAP